MIRRIGPACLLLTVTSLTFASLVHACDTPVYRYAMYRWLPAPYEVYYFHEGEWDDTARQVKAAIKTAGPAAEAPANVAFFAVDLAKDQDLVGVPPDIKTAWQKQDQLQLPSYFVSSPIGGHLFSGVLSLADLDAMIDSPARQQVAQALEAGKAGVYILMTSDNAQADVPAEQVIQGVVDDVAAGRVSLYTLPSSDPEATLSGEGSSEARLEIGLVKLARSDPQEKWLVDMLLSLEPDLRETKEPIVFMIYGRGRALFSCLGKGIHRDNLIQDVEFITGACSCTVKEQNPGVDLLMRHNWEAAAEAIAARYGAEEGSHYDFGGDALFPELILPAEGEMPGSGVAAVPPASDQTLAQVAPSTEPAVWDPQPKTSQTDRSLAAASVSEGSTGAASEERTSLSTSPNSVPSTSTGIPADEPTVAPSTAADAQSGPSGSTFRGVLWVGAGLLGALVVLFAATFVVLRPR